MGLCPGFEKVYNFFKKGVKFSKRGPIYITSKGNSSFTNYQTYSMEAVRQ